MWTEVARLAEFLVGIFTTWVVLVGGPILTLIGIGERIIRKEVSWRLYVSLLVALLMCSFYISWRDTMLKLERVPMTSAPPIRLDVTDVQGRQEIETLRKQLSAANETIRALQSDSDVFAKPISSCEFSVALRLSSASAHGNYQNLATFAGAGLFHRGTLSLGGVDGPRALLSAKTSQFETQSGELRITAPCQLDSPAMDKPIRELADASLLQVLVGGDMGATAGGQVTLILNSNVTLTFRVPGDIKPVQIADGIWSYGITDLKNGLSPLRASRPSSTPDTEPSTQ